MAPFETILYNVEANGVATITLNRADRGNSLSWAMFEELRRAFTMAGDDPGVRVVVLTATGEKAFCTGADLAGMNAGGSFADLHDSRGAIPRLMRVMWEFGKPTIARVVGYCLAGGFGLALSCDILIASD